MFACIGSPQYFIPNVHQIDNLVGRKRNITMALTPLNVSLHMSSQHKHEHEHEQDSLRML